MKVGYFSHTSLEVSETFIHDLVRDLNIDNELDLTYFCGLSSGKLSANFKLKSVFTSYSISIPILYTLIYKIRQFFNSKNALRYKMTVQKKLALRALQRNVKEKIDVAYVDYANSAVLVREFFKANRIPFIVHVHGYDVTSCLNDPFYVTELSFVLNEAKSIVVASDFIKRLLILQGADEKKIFVIRYGIHVESIKPMLWSERFKNNPSIIFLGRLTEKKHPIALLYAFKLVLDKIPNVKLTIIGDGPLKGEIINRITVLGLQNSVELLGSLSQEKSFVILNNHWIYAQHSVTSKNGDQEGYALSLAEAAAHELPVVSTIHNGISEHVIDGKTGYLVPEFNFEAMSEKIIYLIQNPEICQQMGKFGRINIVNMNNQKVRVSSIKRLLYSAFNEVY